MGNAGENLAGPWSQVLGKMQASGTNTGAQASQTVEQLASQMQNAVRETRAASLKAADFVPIIEAAALPAEPARH